MGIACFKQKNGLEALVVVGNCGVVTPEQFSGLAAHVKELEIAALKLTTRQTLVLVLPLEKREQACYIVEELGLKVGTYGGVVRNVKACCGDDDLCTWSRGNALQLGTALQESCWGSPVPKDFKISVAGCSRGCTDPLCADFGAVATAPDSFDIYIGGRGATLRPTHASLLARDITASGVAELVQVVLDRYSELAEPKERFVSLVQRLGTQPFHPGEDWVRQHRCETKPAQDFLDFLKES
ncbi:MAG: nitrite reductase [Firmicutes bacterium]|nr:nitrite reductase [Bacillota bacterium]